jgi:hypothetical protein
MEDSRFKTQDPGFQNSLPEKQQITISYYGGFSDLCVWSFLGHSEHAEAKTFVAQQRRTN